MKIEYLRSVSHFKVNPRRLSKTFTDASVAGALETHNGKFLPGVAFIMVWVWGLTMPNYAACSEKYYINDNPVLLYKAINWWYDCLPEESHQLCGSLIRCQAKENIQIEYDAIEKTLMFNVKKGFAELLSIFKQCQQCWGPSYLRLTWLNKEYFGDGEILSSTESCSTIPSFTFTHIKIAHARKIQNIAVIGLELEGRICGLMNGKIALHHAGNLLKTCKTNTENTHEKSPIRLRIVNFQTEEILAKFSMIFDNKNHNRGKSGHWD